MKQQRKTGGIITEAGLHGVMRESFLLFSCWWVLTMLFVVSALSSILMDLSDFKLCTSFKCLVAFARLVCIEFVPMCVVSCESLGHQATFLVIRTLLLRQEDLARHQNPNLPTESFTKTPQSFTLLCIGPWHNFPTRPRRFPSCQQYANHLWRVTLLGPRSKITCYRRPTTLLVRRGRRRMLMLTFSSAVFRGQIGDGCWILSGSFHHNIFATIVIG